MKTQLALFGVVCFLWLAPRASAHYWITKPVGREKKGAETDNGNKVGCVIKERAEVTSYQAGEAIDVRYWRNNHLGGFTRWAIAASGNETKESFDNGVFFYTCRESGKTCVPKGKNEPLSPDQTDENVIVCGDKITLPDHLPAGDYVLQVMWHGVGSSYGHDGWQENTFKSCADIKLTTSGTKKAPACPKFVGGDRVTELQKKGADSCFYFHTNEISEDLFKGEDSKAMDYYKFGVPAAVAKCGGGGNGGGGAEEKSAKSSAPPQAKKSCTRKTRRLGIGSLVPVPFRDGHELNEM